MLHTQLRVQKYHAVLNSETFKASLALYRATPHTIYENFIADRLIRATGRFKTVTYIMCHETPNHADQSSANSKCEIISSAHAVISLEPK